MKFHFIIFSTLCFIISNSVFSQRASYTLWQETKLDYELSIGFFKVGSATMQYKKNRLSKEAKMMARGWSTGVVDFFYDFDFMFTNRVDAETGLPIIATKQFKEGKYLSQNTVRFDHQTRSDSTIIYSDSLGMRVVPKNIFDILTGVYHIMNNELTDDLVMGDTISTTCYFTDEVWELRIIYIRDERIKTSRGYELCQQFYLIPQKGYFFKNDDDVSFWFSKGEDKIPVKIRMNFVLSSMKAELTTYKNTISNKSKLLPSGR